MALEYSFVLSTVHYAVYNLRVDRKIVLSIALVLFLFNVKNTDHISTVYYYSEIIEKFNFPTALVFLIKRENTDRFSTVYYYSELIESLLFR